MYNRTNDTISIPSVYAKEKPLIYADAHKTILILTH